MWEATPGGEQQFVATCVSFRINLEALLPNSPSLDRDRRIVVSSSTPRGKARHICCRRRLSCADGGPRSAGLLLPSLNVHARHEEPQHRQSFHEEGGGQTVPGQIVCERWCQEGQPTQA